MKSGMLAADTIFDALKAGDTSSKTLSAFPKKIEQSYIKKELWQVEIFISPFNMECSLDSFTPRSSKSPAGAGLIDPMRAHAGHEAYKKSTDGRLRRDSRATAS